MHCTIPIEDIEGGNTTLTKSYKDWLTSVSQKAVPVTQNALREDQECHGTVTTAGRLGHEEANAADISDDARKGASASRFNDSLKFYGAVLS